MKPVRRISIVDDDAAIRAALSSLMRSVNFQAQAFGSAEEFLASDRAKEADCLIFDVYLPGMTGLELQERLRTDPDARIASLPVIFITAHADEISRQRALKAGAAHFLAKPVGREDLFKAIESAISR